MNTTTKQMAKILKVSGWVSGMMLVVGSAWAIDVAKVNGKGLSDADIRQTLSGVSEGQRAALMRNAATKRQVVLELIDQEILLQQAQKEKIDQTAEYKNAMEAFRRQYLANQLFSKNLSAKTTEEAAKKYYKGHLAEFSTDSIHVQHILAADEFTAKNLLAEVQKPGADFQVVAEKSSRDPSAKNNRGEVGWVTHSSPLAREFKDAAFQGEKGQIVGPVRTSFGYHLIKIVDKRIGKPLEYDEVELQVKSALREELSRNYLMSLKKSAKVQLDEKAIESL